MWFSPEGGFNLGLYTDCFHWVRVRDFFEEPQPSLSEPDVFIHPEVPEGQNTVMQTKHGGIPAVEDVCVLTGSSVQKSCFQKVTMMDSKLTLTPAGRSSWMLTGYKARLPHCFIPASEGLSSVSPGRSRLQRRKHKIYFHLWPNQRK